MHAHKPDPVLGWPRSLSNPNQHGTRPYKQIDEPDWSDLFAVLRRTSVALKLPEMERDACLILKRAEQRGQAP